MYRFEKIKNSENKIAENFYQDHLQTNKSRAKLEKITTNLRVLRIRMLNIIVFKALN